MAAFLGAGFAADEPAVPLICHGAGYWEQAASACDEWTWHEIGGL